MTVNHSNSETGLSQEDTEPTNDIPTGGVTDVQCLTTDRPKWFWCALAAVASGAMMAGCYWPLNLHWLAWVALVPWLCVLPRLDISSAWVFGTLLGVVFYRLTLAWLFGLSGPHAAFLLLVLSGILGLSFSVACGLMRYLGVWTMVWVVPLCVGGAEILRSESLPRFRFSYGGWGYSQAHNLPVAQIASLGGVYFVTAAVVAFNAALAFAVIRRRQRAWIPFAVISCLLIILVLVAQPESFESQPSYQAACVQCESYDHDEYATLARQCFEGPTKPTFVVLPEHTIVEYADEKTRLVRQLAELATGHNAYICIGAHVETEKPILCSFDNTAMTIGPTGRIIHTQAKTVPIPFFSLDGNPATNQTVFETPYGDIGAYVCYDGGFTDVVRRLSELGAELLLGPVMNPEGWPVQQRWQQADMARFRSIEVRRCAIRAASSGVSQIIDATGTVRECRTQEQGPGILTGRVYLTDTMTPFVRGGYRFSDIVGWSFLIAAAGVMICQSFSSTRKRLRRLVSRSTARDV